jgi:hypothetical protein
MIRHTVLLQFSDAARAHAPAEMTFDCAADLDAYVNSEAHVRLGREHLAGAYTAVLGSNTE